MRLYLIIFLFFIPLTFAHLEGEGKEVGDYRIEFAKIDDVVKTDKSTAIVFYIENRTTGERVKNLDAWLRVSYEDSVLFSNPNTYQDNSGALSLTYNFPFEGEYEIKVQFDVDGKKVGTEFNLEVEGKNNSKNNLIILGSLIFGILLVPIDQTGS